MVKLLHINLQKENPASFVEFVDVHLLIWWFSFQIGLEGEHLRIYQKDGLGRVKWISTSEPPKEQPLTWYKVKAEECHWIKHQVNYHFTR